MEINRQYINADMFGEKIKVSQMFSSTNIVSLLVSISMNIRLYFGAKIVVFSIKYIGNRKIILAPFLPNPINRVSCVFF